MKKAFLLLVIALFYTLASSQIVYLNYFDTPDEQNAWTQYRLGDSDSHDWEFVTGFPYSAPSSLYHDYPMDNGVTYVEDWFVSPALNISLNGILSVFVAQNRMSNPPNVYFGIWFSNGDKDPATGDYVELADLTLFPVAQGVYEDTAFQIPYQGDTSYIAFKYTAGYFEWLMLWIDDLAIIGAYPVGIEEEGSPENINVNIFPNPYNDYCKIIIDQTIIDKYQGDLRIEIYDHMGRKVREINNISSEVILKGAGMKTGCYYYSLKSNNNQLCSGKMIKN